MTARFNRRLDGYGLAGGGLDHPHRRIPRVDLRFKPVPRIGLAVAEQHHPGLHLAHKVEEVVAIGMRGEIKFLNFALADHLAGASAEMERLAGLAREGKGVAVALHDVNLAFRYASRIAFLKEGRLLGVFRPSEVDESVLESVFEVGWRFAVGPGLSRLAFPA